MTRQPITTGDPALAAAAGDPNRDLGSSPAGTNLNESEGIGEAHPAHMSAVERTNPNYRLLYDPSDRESLCDLLCLVRLQIEVFAATAEDAADRASRGGAKDIVEPGRVGIRCRWCCNPSQGGNIRRYRRTRGAVSYPKSLRLVYQSVRNFQRFHMLECPAVPDDVKHQFLSIKSNKPSLQGRSANKSVLYWEEHCKSLGMVDTDRGITLQQGRTFKDVNEGDEEVGVTQSETDGSCVPASLGLAAAPLGGMQGGTAVEGAEAKVPLSVNESLSDDVAFQGCTGHKEPMKAGMAFTQKRGPPSHDALLTDKCAAEQQSGSQQTKGSPEGQSHRDDELSANENLNSTRPNLCQGVEPQTPNTSKPKVTNSNGSRHVAHGCSANPSFLLGPPSKDSSSAPDTSSLATSLKVPLEVVVEQVGLAYETVKAISEMRPLPPSDLGSNAQLQQRLKHELDDMTAIGAELYELFSGRHLLDSRDNLGFVRIHEGSIDGTDNAPDLMIRTDSSCDSNDVGGTGLADHSLDRSRYSSGDDGGRHCHKRRGKRESEASNRGRGIGGYVPLSELGLPKALCSLVSSLLNGDGFYSSVHEVQEDLNAICEDPNRFLFETCTGTLDVPKDVLFGRDEEMRLLLDAYDRAVSGDRPTAREGWEGGGTVEVVMISGYSGTGKSSIVRAARSQFVSLGARFVCGKFDAMRQIRPLSAIVSALNEFCDLLASMNESDLTVVREAIGNAVGGEVRVLVDLIPNLGKIINVSDEPSLPQGGREAQQRLMFLFRMLLRVTCSPVHPIVLFLDDLQWADEASLQLLHVLMTDIKVRGLLFVGCYRDNEVNGPDHPLILHLEDLRRTGVISVASIQVGNLDRDSINALVSHSLRMVPRTTRSLSDEVLHKTGGNALFAIQLLAALVDSGLLRFSLLRQQWEWDLNGIRARDIADNVLELMTAKLLTLPHQVQEMLRVVAAFGAQCQDEILQILDRGDDIFPKWNSRGKVGFAGILVVAITEGLVVKIGTAYRFSHDQIQRAAYLLTPEVERASFHLWLGQCLWKQSTAKEVDEFLFVVVDQLHRGVGLIVDREEKVNLARLCLKAGKKASGMSSFLPASVYFKAGITLLADDDWTSNRDLCLELYNSCAETEFILADFPEMQKHLGQVFVRARSLREELRAYYTLVQSLGSQGKFIDALSTSIKVLEHLGVEFPSVLSEEAVKQDVAITVKLVRKMTNSSLLHLETMRDTEKKEAMRFLNVMALYAFVDNKRYYPLVMNHMVRLSLSHGVCRESTHAFAGYGLVTCAIGDMRNAYRFGKLAVALLERFQAKEFYAKVCGAVYGYINTWIEPIQSCLPIIKEAVNVGLSTGDTEFAMVNAIQYVGTALNTGQPLGPLLEEMESCSKQMLEYCQLWCHKRAKVFLQTTLSLLGESADPVGLIGEGINKEDLLRYPEDGKGKKTLTPMGELVYFHRIWVAYLFGRYDVAAEMVEMIMGTKKNFRPRIITWCNHFYMGLVALALGRKTGESKWRETAEKCIEQIKEWAELSEWNCLHKLELLNAEYAYLQGDFGLATKTYTNSVMISTRHHFIHEQALALERAGIFHLETGDSSMASGLFKRAHECYSKWGALKKMKHLQEHYL